MAFSFGALVPALASAQLEALTRSGCGRFKSRRKRRRCRKRRTRT